MTVHAFTSFTYSYLNRARVLAATLKKHHPEWVIWAVLTDKEPDGYEIDWTEEKFDRLLTAEDLYDERTEPWLFGHDVVEACTAVKGEALLRILDEPGCEKVLYFDPDTAVFNNLSELVDLLDANSIVLTPHQIAPEEVTSRSAIIDNEVASLNYGIFNLGFVAVANDSEARRFAQWWADRLNSWCHDRLDIGLFVDQKWCNLVPCFFDGVRVLRDPGYNVASWNLSQRRMRFDDSGRALINGRPLRFYHFTKLGEIGDLMTRRYARDNLEIYELWFWYRNKVREFTDGGIPVGFWHYSTFDNGIKIPKEARVLYRERADLQAAFKQPRSVENGFFGWLKNETGILST